MSNTRKYHKFIARCCLRVCSTSKQCHRQWRVMFPWYWAYKKIIVYIPAILLGLAKETSYLATNSKCFSLSPCRRAVGWSRRHIRLLCNDSEDNESFWAYFSKFVDAKEVPNTTNSWENCCNSQVCLHYRSTFMWPTWLIWISQVMNTIDVGFTQDEHDWHDMIMHPHIPHNMFVL